MALIQCPECNNKISDKSKNCIHCGYPIASNIKQNYIHSSTQKLLALALVMLIITSVLLIVGKSNFAEDKSEISVNEVTSNTESPSISDEFIEVKPYLKYLGTELDGTTLKMDETEKHELSDVHIAGYSGTITYKVSSLGHAFNIAGIMIWDSNNQTHTLDSYKAIRDAIVNYYNVVNIDSYITDEKQIKCRNNEYVIECIFNDDGSIRVIWTYNIDNYNKYQVAGYSAIKYLKECLKNPESLQVHSVSYATYVYCHDCENAIGIKIDYSAQNGFGGTNRENFYCLIDPNNNLYTSVNTLLGAETILEDCTFVSISIEDISSMRKKFDDNLNTIVCALKYKEYPSLANVMDSRLMSYTGYLDISYSESGFTPEQSKTTNRYMYSLENAFFLDEECDISVWYFDWATNGVANYIEIGYPMSTLSLEEIKTRLSEKMEVDPYYESENAFYLYIPETNLEIQVFKFAESMDADIYIRYREE